MEYLETEALSHRAVQHPYLKALAHGDFPDMHAVLKDFATQYGFYSAWFPRYLTAVISRLERPDFRRHLLDNLAEESGQLHEEDFEKLKPLGIERSWVDGIPHPLLFKQFQHAMGVNADVQPDIVVEVWRESFLQLVQYGSPAEAVGAIGLGTESIVKTMCRTIIEAIRNHTDLSLQEYVFFPLHTEVDDAHGLILLDIAKQMAEESPQQAIELRKGMHKALNFRSAFWDGMHERALKLSSRTHGNQLIVH